MATTVRCFAYSGSIALPNASNNGQLVTTHDYMVKQRYLARETLSPDTSTAATSATALSADTNVKMLLVQVQPGKRVHYEVYGPNISAVPADSNSPVIENSQPIEFYPGWRLSVLEVTEAA